MTKIESIIELPKLAFQDRLQEELDGWSKFGALSNARHETLNRDHARALFHRGKNHPITICARNSLLDQILIERHSYARHVREMISLLEEPLRTKDSDNQKATIPYLAALYRSTRHFIEEHEQRTVENRPVTFEWVNGMHTEIQQLIAESKEKQPEAWEKQEELDEESGKLEISLDRV